MRSSRVFAKQLPHTRLYLDLVSLGAEGTNVRKVDSVKQRQDVTHASLIHGTPDAAFIYPLAQDANAQVPLVVGLQ